MRLLLCGGGTAGHITPAIAIAEELMKKAPDSRVLFVGREGGSENDAIKQARFEIQTIKMQGLIRSFSLKNIGRILNACRAQREAKKIISDFRPDAILGTGGYVCWPIINAGHKFNIPIFLHESNAVPGITTKLLSPKCNAVFVGVPTVKDHLSKKAKIRVVGNPIRESFISTARDHARNDLKLKKDDIFIVSFGGSIGADKLNESINEVMRSYSSKNKSVKHLHATGKRYYRDDLDYAVKKDGCHILPYIKNMPSILSAADIAICRCGAMTLSELAAIGVASILIPSPNVSGNHQYMNARYFSDNGAAVLLEEKDLNGSRLIDEISRLQSSISERKNKAERIKSLSTPDAAKKIVTELISVSKAAKRPF